MKLFEKSRPDVLEFYRKLPFNFAGDPASDVASIRAQDQVLAYPVLAPLLRPGTTVLDLGCGAGWLSNSISHHRGCSVTGVDFNPVAVARAREIAAALGTDCTFLEQDLFLYSPDLRFDLVASVGVLHHTGDCQAGVAKACSLTRPGGHVFIGLYHAHGRAPFLEHFAVLRDRGQVEEQLFAEFARLTGRIGDETFLRSWFRDQVLHPHETQHTLAEMLPLLEAHGMNLVSTSINGFAPLGNRNDLLSLEPHLAATGREKLAQGKYYPGFFVFLARRCE